MPSVSLGAIKRHLRMPPGAPLDETLATRIADARRWFAEHARAWSRRVPVGAARIEGARIEVAGGPVLTSELVARRFADAGVDTLEVVAASAGLEVDAAVEQLWRERPDDAMCIHACAVATIEALRRVEVGRAVREARAAGGRVLAAAPGNPGWDLCDQATLFELVSGHDLPGPLELLDSLQLRPVRSTLTAIGRAAKTESR